MRQESKKHLLVGPLMVIAAVPLMIFLCISGITTIDFWIDGPFSDGLTCTMTPENCTTSEERTLTSVHYRQSCICQEVIDERDAQGNLPKKIALRWAQRDAFIADHVLTWKHLWNRLV